MGPQTVSAQSSSPWKAAAAPPDTWAPHDAAAWAGITLLSSMHCRAAAQPIPAAGSQRPALQVVPAEQASPRSQPEPSARQVATLFPRQDKVPGSQASGKHTRVATSHH